MDGFYAPIYKKGETALITACLWSNYECAELLIKNSANIEIKDNSGNKALYYAKQKENKNLIKLLEKL